MTDTPALLLVAKVALVALVVLLATHAARRLGHGVGGLLAGLPLIAVNDVIMHDPDRRALADVVTCIREHTTIDKAGARRLAANAERHLKAPQDMARLFANAPQARRKTQSTAAQIAGCDGRNSGSTQRIEHHRFKPA